MSNFENYKKNFDILDKYDLYHTNVDKSTICSGSLANVKKKDDEQEKYIPPLAAAVVGINNTAAPLPIMKDTVNLWSKIDIQESYLSSKPTCYLILSKPGLNADSLGEAISKKLNCVHLCPKNIITDELDQNSVTGKSIDFNIRHNNICRFDVVLKMLQKKLLSPAVKHRGYIISGFPMVTVGKHNLYLFEKLYGEKSLLIAADVINEILNNAVLKKKRKRIILVEGEEEMEEEEEEEEIEIEEEEIIEEEENVHIDLPKFFLDTCVDVLFAKKAHFDTKKAILMKQFYTLLNLVNEPDIIIYMICPDADVVTLKNKKHFNYITSHDATEPFLVKKKQLEVEQRWPRKFSVFDTNFPRDSNLNIKYWCKPPLNFEQNVCDQLYNYNTYILPIVEKQLQGYDPKYIIKVDGRLPVIELVQQLSEQFVFMPIEPVIIPEPLYFEGPLENMDDFWHSIEETNTIRIGAINMNRCVSLWYNRCPVELKRGKTVIGHSKHAVGFLNHVYVLSSPEAMVSFCRNPRPFLKLEYLEPICRIIVLGTKLSGKTMISKCLSWLFDAPIINYIQFVEKERQNKYQIYSERILSEISARIEDARFLKWEQSEAERLSALHNWYSETYTLLQNYVHNHEQMALLERGKHAEREIERYLKYMVEFIYTKSQLLNLPFLNDINICKNILSNKDGLEGYAPTVLKNLTAKPRIPVVGDSDVAESISEYILNNELHEELEPTFEEIINELVKHLTFLDEIVKNKTNEEKLYGKWIIDGFPSNPQYWSFLNDSNFLPDNTIFLIENRDVTSDLLEHYKVVEQSFKKPAERFVLANDPLIKLKLLSNKPIIDDHFQAEQFFKDLLNNVDDIVESLHPTSFESGSEVQDDDFINADALSEDWDSIKIILEENRKSFIEVELQEKSDIEIVEEVLLKLRKTYSLTASVNEDEENVEDEQEGYMFRDLRIYNPPQHLCETGIYCPVAFYNYKVLWEGKPEFKLKYDNKIHYFCNEDCIQLFEKDMTKYQSFNKPYKIMPPLKVCVIGCIGSGKTTVSKFIAKELGLLHIDFSMFINDNLLPKHSKKVGRQYENPFTDIPFDNEAVIDFETDNAKDEDENLFNDDELRLIIYNYFERGANLPPSLIEKLISKLWFQEPYSSIGFVLDGFPRLTSDVECIITKYCIPDLVIELEGNIDRAISRTSPIMFQRWKQQLSEAKISAKFKFKSDRDSWMQLITKHVVTKLIYDDIVNNVFPPEPEPDINELLSIGSTMMSSEPVEPSLLKIYKEVVQIYPEPIDEKVWDRPNDIQETIDTRIENIHEIEDDNIQNLKDLLLEQKVKTVTVNGTFPLDKVIRLVMSKLSSFTRRNESFFEQTFLIENDIAEILLVQGLYFLSKFRRMCPVYIYEHSDCIQNPYKISRKYGKVYPVLHRSYIYFTCSRENLKKFRQNPLKYVVSDAIKLFLEFPLRIGIIGPSKSGKSTLALKLVKKYGLMPVSKGMSLKYVVENLSWTELASKITSTLEQGKCVRLDHIVEALQTMLLNHCTFTHGFVLDGLPETPAEAFQLSKAGIYPMIMLDLECSKEKVLDNAEKQIYFEILKRMPPYPSLLSENRFTKWAERCHNIRNWINQNCDNLISVNAEGSRWLCIKNTSDIIEKINAKIHYYLLNVNRTIVPMDVMCVTNEYFEKKMSPYKNYCPICFHKNKLRNSNFPVDRKGVVQYKNNLYWICAHHMKKTMNNPERYLKPRNVTFPEIAATVSYLGDSQFYEDGICIVTYAENLPSQRIVKGDQKFAASYRGKTYLFCTQKCLKKFLEKPHLYFEITVFKGAQLPQITLKDLPHLGYLEQTVGNLITDACIYVNVIRPKYPGLSIAVSGALLIALYLKTHNPLTKSEVLPQFVKSKDKYEARSSRVPVPDERYDYLCEYHKPASKVPAFLNVVDIAGLVKGAAEGQGLGNAFLSHIKACDAIFNLCRAFEDEDVIHVDGEVNPVRDLETIGEELRLKDEEELMKNIEKLDRQVNRGTDKKLKPEYDTLMKIKGVLVDEKKHIRFGDWSVADIEILNKYLFITSKPALYLVNLSEKDYIRKKNKWLPKLKEWIDKNDPGAPLVPFSGVLEAKLFEMDPEEKKAFLEEHKITSALDKIIVAGYKALQLEYFFTAGADEVKAWTIQKGTKAPQAAGRIHTDFEKGFIMAEVMHFKDFKEEGTEAACKSAGKYRQQGRNYVVEDGDIIFFKFNAGAGLKDAKKK